MKSLAISRETKSLLTSPSLLAPDLSSCGKILSIDLWADISDQSVKDIMGGVDMVETLRLMLSDPDPSKILENIGDPEVNDKLWILKEEGLCYINIA